MASASRPRRVGTTPSTASLSRAATSAPATSRNTSALAAFSGADIVYPSDDHDFVAAVDGSTGTLSGVGPAVATDTLPGSAVSGVKRRIHNISSSDQRHTNNQIYDSLATEDETAATAMHDDPAGDHTLADGLHRVDKTGRIVPIHRRQYTPVEKQLMRDIYSSTRNNISATQRVMEKEYQLVVSRPVIRRIVSAKSTVDGSEGAEGMLADGSRRGRPVCAEFEREMLEQLFGRDVDLAGSLPPAIVTYKSIETVAKALQQSDRWRDDRCVQKLRFSSGWVANFLKRHKMEFPK